MISRGGRSSCIRCVSRPISPPQPRSLPLICDLATPGRIPDTSSMSRCTCLASRPKPKRSAPCLRSPTFRRRYPARDRAMFASEKTAGRRKTACPGSATVTSSSHSRFVLRLPASDCIQSVSDSTSVVRLAPSTAGSRSNSSKRTSTISRTRLATGDTKAFGSGARHFTTTRARGHRYVASARNEGVTPSNPRSSSPGCLSHHLHDCVCTKSADEPALAASPRPENAHLGVRVPV